jgi:tetratricopeptide (TPR) repeat protein
LGIVGRRQELEAIGQLLDQEGAGVAALLLDGEAGIGKTTIWEWGLEAARERNLLLLSSQPAETEASLPFVVLGDLLEPVLADVLPVLAEPQRLAIEAALSLVEPAEPLGRLAIARAVLSAFRELAGREPLVVAVDDVQWIDPASAGALEFATRRMTDLPVRLLLARRTDLDAAAPPWLAQGLASYDVQGFRVVPLAPNELDTVLRLQLGLRLARARLGELHRASGGNPFYALEIAAAAQRRGTLAGKAPLQVPGSLGDLLRERLAELSPDARAAVLLAAASSQAPASAVEQAAGGHEGLDEAVQRAVLELDGERLRFTHPLLSSVAYGLAEPGERRRAHLRLAEATADPEERARQLGLGAEGPDETVAALLEEAAGAAGARGGSEAAAELYELAAGLTPDEFQDRRHRRRFQAARHEILAGDIAHAAAVLHELVDLLPAGPERAEALVCLADFEDDPAAGRDLCLQALEETQGELRLRAEASRMLAEFLMTLGDLDAALEHARLAASLAESCGDETQLVQSLGVVAHFETYTAEITDGLL